MFSIVIPFYNEQNCIEEVVMALIIESRCNKLPVEFVLVNNGSSDKTGEIIRRLEKKYKEIRGITVEKNNGYGYGIRKGLESCKTAYLGFMCGDGQIDASDVTKVVKVLQRNSHVDICKVVRLKRYDGLKRRLISLLYNNIFRLLFFFPMLDINGTPKVFKYKWYKKLTISSDDWFIDAEFMLKARMHNMIFYEVPTVFYSRSTGFSHVNNATIIEFLKNLVIFRFKTPLIQYTNSKKEKL